MGTKVNYLFPAIKKYNNALSLRYVYARIFPCYLAFCGTLVHLPVEYHNGRYDLQSLYCIVNCKSKGDFWSTIWKFCSKGFSMYIGDRIGTVMNFPHLSSIKLGKQKVTLVGWGLSMQFLIHPSHI